MNINLEKNREVMIENQLKPNKITNTEILGIFNQISKENFISKDKINVCYSDQDISVKDSRGYLKNLHLAQILHFAEISSHEKILHIGGLTGYLSVLISKLCNEIYVTDDNEDCLEDIIKNFRDNKVNNGYVYKSKFSEGLKKKEPFVKIYTWKTTVHFNRWLERIKISKRKPMFLETTIYAIVHFALISA